MLPPIAERQQNLLIAALPGADVERLAPHLERVSLPLDEMLYEPGQQLQHAYFPTSAIVSLHCLTHAGASAESAGVGNDGVGHLAVHGRRHHTRLGRGAQRVAAPAG